MTRLYYHEESEDDDVDSLFDSTSPTLERLPYPTTATPHVAPRAVVTAKRTAPPIPGLYFDPSIRIPPLLARELTKVAAEYFHSPTGAATNINQVMFFGRTVGPRSGLPPFLDNLAIALSEVLTPHLPTHVHQMLFRSSASASGSRQAILNHYLPGEGITPHVDLLTRFADGIVAVSLGSGTVMTFRSVESNGAERCDLYLPEQSVLVLTGDARYKWSHGIEERVEDCIENGGENLWLRRGNRISITLRWLLPGGDIVGGNE